MDDVAFALDAADDASMPAGKDRPPVLFVELRPDHEIGDAGLVLQGDEDDALGRAGLLADQHQAGDLAASTRRGAAWRRRRS